MKICILTKDASINGGNRVALALAKYLGAAGHSVSLCLSQHSGSPTFALDDLTVTNPSAALQAVYDCAICTYFSEAEVFGRIDATKKIRYVQANYWKNGDESDERRRLADDYFKDQEIDNVAVSTYIQEVLLTRGIAARVVHPTIEQHAFGFEPDLCDGRFRILIEGTANKWKRLRESMDSIPRGIEVWCLSSGPVPIQADRNWTCPEQAVLPKIMSACDLIVKLSEMEGCPLVLLECMKCGVVPIVLNTGGQLDYCVDGLNSFLVTSADEVPGVIERYLALGREAKADLAANAIAAASSRTWSGAAAEFLAIIETGRH